MLSTVTVAAIQFTPERGNVGLNIARARQLAFEASLMGANVIVLPELCTAGPGLSSVREAAMCSQSVLGPQTEAMAQIAMDTGITIVFGYVEAGGGAFYNSAALILPDGQVFNFRKRNLWGDDYFWATAGEVKRSDVVVTPWGRIGVLICGDAENKPRAPVNMGVETFYSPGSVDLVCVPAMWNTQLEFPDSSWVDLSKSLKCHVAVANRGGEIGEDFAGGSCVIDRTQVVIADGQDSIDEPAFVGARITIGSTFP